jgi:argininosuccinate lyase
VIAKTAAAGGPVLDPEILAFTSSLAHDRALLREDVTGSLAHLAMLAKCALVPEDAALALARGLFAIEADGTLPEEEDIHMAIEASLHDRVGEASLLLHTARSRNDQVALALRLHVREQCAIITEALAALALELVARAESDVASVLPAYTHRQRAQPVRLAYFWLGHAAPLVRDAGAFRAAHSQADAMPLGVGAIAGTSLPIDRELVRRLLCFDRLTINGLDTVGDRDFVLDYAFAASKMLVHASRLATDLVDFATSEFGFVELGAQIACGSSMMPQKRNPDVFELVRGKAGAQMGDLLGLLATMKGLPGGYNRDMQEDRAPLLATGTRARSVVSALRKALSHVTFDAAKCAAAVADGTTQATDLAEALVQKGVPFRTAYRLVGELVRVCREESVPLSEVTPERARRVDERFDEGALAVLRAEGAADRKKSVGGTGRESVALQIETLRAAAEDARRAARAMPRLGDLLASLKEMFP